MKSYNFNFTYCLFIIFLGNFSIAISQVGINTTTPRKALEVAGDMAIDDAIDINTINALSDNESNTFLIQNVDAKIKVLDVSNPTGAALGYIQQYVVENPYADWVQDFDTGIDATDYVLITISSYFNDDLNLSDSGGLSDNFSLPYTATFINGGTWHIIANYPVAGNFGSTNIGSWTINTLIFSKDLSKQFGTVSIPMSDTSTGSATTPIIN